MAFKQCSVEGCRNSARALSLCNLHYKRVRKHGDPSIRSANNGRINPSIDSFMTMLETHTGSECLIWPFSKNSAGYPVVNLDKKKTLVHRYACERRNGPPPSPEHQARHLCGKGTDGCVNPSHLAWGTSAENAGDRFLHGTIVHGEAHPSAKLTVIAVEEILGSSASAKSLAKKHRVSHSTIASVRSGKTWARVSRRRRAA